jgi:hypothetical protein
MKSIYLIVAIALLSSFTAKCQTAYCAITFGYDDNGYRITRKKTCYYNGPGTQVLREPVQNDTNALKPIDQFTVGTYQIYPNPAINQANIKLDAVSLQSVCSITITDVLGKMLKRQYITDPVTGIDISGFANGTYFFVLRRGDKMNTVRLVKLDGIRD